MADSPLPAAVDVEGAGATTTPAPAVPAAATAEESAWAEVQARWADQAVHLAYLSRFPDLDGLTTAGRRYRDALAARPGDAVALAMKAEVVKRATVVGLAMLPRTAPPRVSTSGWRRIAVFFMAAWITVAAAWLAWKLLNGPLP